MSFFLSDFEIDLIKNDHLDIIESPESTPLVIRYQRGLGSMTLDTPFSVQEYSETEEVVVSGSGCSSIQHIVTIRDEEVLRFGVLEIGDCIFYVSTDLDLSVGIPGSLILEDPGGIQWVPVPRKLNSFYRYLQLRVGSNQFLQVVPAKLKR